MNLGDNKKPNGDASKHFSLRSIITPRVAAV